MEGRRPRKDFGDAMMKPLWKAPWFWLIVVALIAITLPVFNDSETQIPDDVDDSFYYSARDAYEDYMDGWLDRQVPETISAEWTSHLYEQIHSDENPPTDQEPLSTTEEEIIEYLYVMLQELSNYEEAWSNGVAYERDPFFDAAGEVADRLNLEISDPTNPQ